MAARPPRRGLGALFLVLTLLLAGIAAAALREGVWPIGVPAAVIAAWMATMAAASLRSR